MADKLLTINELSASVFGKPILDGVNLNIGKGETHVLMGPNGAGKSTLGNVIMGNPVYTLDGGSITFDGEDITGESTDKRAKRGMFLSFQNPLEVPGLSLEEFIRNAIRQKTGKPIKIFAFRKQLAAAMELLGMDPSYAERDLNVGFSGGEKKKAEILQFCSSSCSNPASPSSTRRIPGSTSTRCAPFPKASASTREGKTARCSSSHTPPKSSNPSRSIIPTSS